MDGISHISYIPKITDYSDSYQIKNMFGKQVVFPLHI